jgi:DNA-binding MarR family transcriptional regulator/N-acetylglutamate synthase-like GNAT family acetyltransferase
LLLTTSSITYIVWIAVMNKPQESAMQPSIGILLRELARLYTQAQRDNVTSGYDTSSTQSHVLIELGRAGLLTQHELGRRLSLDKGWVSRAVDSLVQSGLITKSRHENDRRSRWLQLTRKGTERYQALNESLDAHAEQLMQPLAAEQRASIYQALVLLLNGLQSALPQEVESAPEMLEAVEAVEAVEPMAAAPAEALTETLNTAEPAELQPEPAPQQVTEIIESVEQLAALDPLPASAPPQAEQAAGEIMTASEEIPLESEAVMAVTSVQETPAQVTSTPAVENHANATKRATPPPSPDAPTRIIGSKTLPIRPLLSSRTQPRTPLSRAAHQAEQRNTPAVDEPASSKPTTIHDSVRTPTRPLTVPSPVRPLSSASATAPAAQAQAAIKVQPVTTIRVSAPSKPVSAAPAATEAHAPAAASSRQNGSLFQKLLSQGSLFNKLLQRDQEPEETLEPEAPVAEVEPEDNLLFQAAFPSDWNEIRNLLTANRLPVQGALNHLTNFVVATENGRVVGALGMEVYGDVGLLRSLVVASNMRGRSIAKRLIKHMISRSREKQLGALYLLAGKTDALFERYGFEKMPRADMPTKLYVSMELQGPSSTASTGMRLIL